MNSSFRELLLRAIGEERTQKQFAEDTGISQVHISRMLSDDFSGTPELQTLEKIADNSEGRVSLAQLKESLGMHVTRKDLMESFSELPYQKRAAIMCNELRSGIRQLTKDAHKFNDFDDLFDILDLLYARDALSHKTYVSPVGKLKDHKKLNGAEKYANGYITWEDDEVSVEFGFTLTFCDTTGGGIIVNNALFDVVTLNEFGHETAKEIVEQLSSGEDGGPEDYPLCYLITVKRSEEDVERDMEGAKRDFADTKVDVNIDMLYQMARFDNEKKVLDTLFARMRREL